MPQRFSRIRSRARGKGSRLAFAAWALCLAACSSAESAGDAGLDGPRGPGLGTDGSEMDTYGTGWDTDRGAGGSGGENDSAGGESGGDPLGTTGYGSTGGTSTGSAPVPPDAGVPDPSPSRVVAAENPSCDPAAGRSLSLFAGDANEASFPARVREIAQRGLGEVPDVAARRQEFLAYYNFFAAARPTEVEIRAALLAGPPGIAEGRLAIGVLGPGIADLGARPRLSLVLVVDLSGSMAGFPLELVRASIAALASRLTDGDTVSIVSWDTANNVVLDAHPVVGPDDPVVLDAAANLQSGGGSDLLAGLKAGYALAARSYGGTQPHIVVLSDGVADYGAMELDLISRNSTGEPGSVHLVGVGVGAPEAYRDDLMVAVTGPGRGPAVYVPTEAEADRVLGEGFWRTVGVFATRLRIFVDLPGGYTLASEEGSLPATMGAEPSLGVGDRLVLEQRLVGCVSDPEGTAEITIRVAYLDPVSGEERAAEERFSIAELRAEAGGASTGDWQKVSAVLEYAKALGRFAATPDAAAFVDARAAVQSARVVAPDDLELVEIADVMRSLESLVPFSPAPDARAP